MRKTTPVMFSGFAIVAFSIYLLYEAGLSYSSFSLTVTLLWIGAFLILVGLFTRKVSNSMKARS